MRARWIATAGLALAVAWTAACGPPADGGDEGAPETALLWIDHLAFRAGDPSLTLSFDAVSSGVGGGLSGLIIESSALGDTAPGGGNKGIEKGLAVPPGWLVTGVRLCYELSDPRTFVTQVRLAQVQDPPQSAVVQLDDGADLTDPGPVCVDSVATSIDPAAGGLRLNLRIQTGDVGDRIVLRAVGLHLEAKP